MSRLPPKAATGMPPADHFTEHRNVRIDVIQRLGAAESNTESGHDFVDDEDGTVFSGFFSHSFEEFLSGGNHVHIPGNCFNDHAGDFVAFFVKEFFELFGIVVFQNDCVVGDSSGNTGRARGTERQQARSRL